MFVVKEGDPSKANAEKTFNCTRCGCVFVAKKEEYLAQLDYGGDVYFMCDCPCCHSPVYSTDE